VVNTKRFKLKVVSQNDNVVNIVGLALPRVGLFLPILVVLNFQKMTFTQILD